MADTKKTLSTHEALHELHKGLTAQVRDWEQKCLTLRKAELAKALPGELSKQPISDGVAPKPPAPAPVAKDEAPSSAGDMEMGEMKLKCSEDALCKCGNCSKLDKYAKGEMTAKSTKEEDSQWEADKVQAQLDSKKPKTPQGNGVYRKQEVPAGSAPDGVSAFDAKGKVPGDKAPKALEGEHTKESGSDGDNIKKAALPGAAPAPAAPKLPGAGGGMPKMPKLPGMGKPAGMAKPAAPAGGAKPPAMGAGTPALKNELAKGVLPPGSGARPSGKPPQTRDQQSQAAKLPGVRASVGGLMDNMLAGGPKPLNPGQPLSIQPIASSAVKLPGAHLSPGQGLMTKTPPAPSTAPTMAAAKASAMPAGQPGSALTPPAAAARPSLPGAHLFPSKQPAPSPAAARSHLEGVSSHLLGHGK